MFPTILLSNNQKTTEDYLDNYSKDNNIDPNNIVRITPLKTIITIDQIRQLKKELIISTATPRLIIFESFETANGESQNALLKVLEEMTANNRFILISIGLEKILPTIVSRCRIVNTERLEEVIEQNTIAAIEKFLNNPSIAYLSEPEFLKTSKEDAAKFFKEAIHIMGIQMKSGKPEFSQLLIKTFDLLHKLQSNNLSPQLTVDSWIIMVVKSV